MSRSIAIWLLAVFMFPLVGHTVLFKYRRSQLRHELKEKLEHSIPRGELELMKIPRQWLTQPPAHFQWTEEHEFRLNGEMYDIVYRETVGDTVTLHCLADKAETILFAQLDQWVEKQNATDPFQRGQAMQWERLWDSLFTGGLDVAPAGYSTQFRRELPAYRFCFTDWEQEITDPPPKA